MQFMTNRILIIIDFLILVEHFKLDHYSFKLIVCFDLLFVLVIFFSYQIYKTFVMQTFVIVPDNVE